MPEKKSGITKKKKVEKKIDSIDETPLAIPNVIEPGELITPPIANKKTDLLEVNDLEIAKKMLKIHQSALDRNLEFNLGFETVRRLMGYKRCYYTKNPFSETGLHARSFDRIDSTKGYIEGNVVACTVDINQKKSNLNIEEIKLLYKILVLGEK